MTVITEINQNLQSIKKKGKLKNVDVAQILSIDMATLEQIEQDDNLSDQETDQKLDEFNKIIVRLWQIYKPHNVRRWLFSRHRVTSQKPPVSIIKNDNDMDRMKDLADKLYLGIFPKSSCSLNRTGWLNE